MSSLSKSMPWERSVAPLPCKAAAETNSPFSTWTAGPEFRHVIHMIFMCIQSYCKCPRLLDLCCVILMQVAMQTCEYNWNFFVLLLGVPEFQLGTSPKKLSQPLHVSRHNFPFWNIVASNHRHWLTSPVFSLRIFESKREALIGE